MEPAPYHGMGIDEGGEMGGALLRCFCHVDVVELARAKELALLGALVFF